MLPHAVVVFTLALPADEPPPAPQPPATGWVSLFDGTSTRGWRSPNGSKWTVSGGMLAPQADKPGLLVSVGRYRQYELKVSYLARTTERLDLLDRGRDGERPSLLLGCDADGERGRRLLLAGVERPPFLRPFPRDTGWVELSVKVTQKGDDLVVRHSYAGKGLSGGGSERLAGKKAEGHIALVGNAFIVRRVEVRPLE